MSKECIQVEFKVIDNLTPIIKKCIRDFKKVIAYRRPSQLLRLPRKLKKRVKANIHRFFASKKSYPISPLINWKVKFKLK